MMFLDALPRPQGLRLIATGLAAVTLSLAGLTGCSTEPDTDEPASLTTPDTARGAADGVVGGAEDGKDLDENLNVPGTETDDEVDSSPLGSEEGD